MIAFVNQNIYQSTIAKKKKSNSTQLHIAHQSTQSNCRSVVTDSKVQVKQKKFLHRQQITSQRRPSKMMYNQNPTIVFCRCATQAAIV